MARVASCPQCNHELMVPSEADGEAWAKCPECRAFFQVKQATLRDVPTALLVEAGEAGGTGEQEHGEPAEPSIAANSDLTVDFSSLATLKDMTEDREGPETVRDETIRDEVESDELALDVEPPVERPKSGDELEAAAQRIDEWFRSAKTVANAAPVTEEEMSLSDESKNSFEPASPAPTNATIDISADDIDEMADMADFDLEEPAESAEPAADATLAWDDSERMEDLLSDIEVPSSDEFVAAVAHEDDEMAVETAMPNEERPSINMFADDAAPEVTTSKRRAPRRERSAVRSLLMITAAGIFGLAAGYYALLWLRGPSVDFLNVAHYLPAAMLPSSFEEPKQIARIAPPKSTADTPAEVEPTTEDSTQPEEPQELAPATEETGEIASTETTSPESAPANVTEEPGSEVQAGYTETEPPAEPVTPAIGDRYATGANDAETVSAEESMPTDVTTEKPETADLTVEELTATDTAAEQPASTELGASEPAIGDPAPLETPAADPLFSDTETLEGTKTIEPVKIANTPSFTADDLRTSLESATKAQPQLVSGNFADGKDVQRAKGAGFSMLADLSQKATFVEEAAKGDAADLGKDADELFRKTLADVHTRSDVAQILPMWMASKNRKHGGVFFAGNVASHEQSGSVVECKVELEGGQPQTVLIPSNVAAESLDSSKPMAIVGWIVDKPKEQVEGYTGSAPQAIFASKLIPLE